MVRIPEKIGMPVILLLRLLLICLLLGIAAGILTGILTGSGLIPGPGPAVQDNGDMPKVMLFFGPLFFAPVFEELIFRAQLRRFSGSILFIAFIAGTILCAITKTNWAYLISPFVFAVLYLVYRFHLSGSVTRKYQFWKRIFPVHFHLTAICFALIHLANFERGITLLPLGLLYTLPQLAAGLVFGYTRMNYGLKYSVALHALYNFIPALLLILKY